MTHLEQKIIKPKLSLLELAKQLGSVSQACKTMGYSRDSFYRFKRLYENGGKEALREISRKKPVIKNRVPEQVERAVIELAGRESGTGATAVLHKSYYNVETMKKRLKALEARSAQEGIVLTEEQIVALEKAKSLKRSPRRNRNSSPGLSGVSGHVFCGNHERSRPHLSANLRRYLFPCGSRFC